MSMETTDLGFFIKRSRERAPLPVTQSTESLLLMSRALISDRLSSFDEE